jgi:hypothetical protein
MGVYFANNTVAVAFEMDRIFAKHTGAKHNHWHLALLANLEATSSFEVSILKFKV